MRANTFLTAFALTTLLAAPAPAQTIYREAFNSAWRQYVEKQHRDEAVCHRIAWAAVKRQYRKNTLARVALWFMVLMAVVAVFADFLANDKPIACNFNGTFYVPVVQEYLVSMGVSSWP